MSIMSPHCAAVLCYSSCLLHYFKGIQAAHPLLECWIFSAHIHRSKTGIVSHLPCYATFPHRSECRHSRKVHTSLSAAQAGTHHRCPLNTPWTPSPLAPWLPPFFFFYFFAAETGTQAQMPSEHSLNTLPACTLAPPFYIFFYCFTLSHNCIIFPFSFLYKCTPPPLPMCLLFSRFVVSHKKPVYIHCTNLECILYIFFAAVLQYMCFNKFLTKKVFRKVWP